MISPNRRSKKESGQSTTEYALMIVILALFAVGAIYAMGGWNSNQVNKAAHSFSAGVPGGGGGGSGSGGTAGGGGTGGSGGSGSGGGAGTGGGAGSGGSGSSGGGSGSVPGGGGSGGGGGAGGGVSNTPVGLE